MVPSGRAGLGRVTLEIRYLSVPETLGGGLGFFFQVMGAGYHTRVHPIRPCLARYPQALE